METIGLLLEGALRFTVQVVAALVLGSLAAGITAGLVHQVTFGGPRVRAALGIVVVCTVAALWQWHSVSSPSTGYYAGGDYSEEWVEDDDPPQPMAERIKGAGLVMLVVVVGSTWGALKLKV